jgi:hypothetical protein
LAHIPNGRFFFPFWIHFTIKFSGICVFFLYLMLVSCWGMWKELELCVV